MYDPNANTNDGSCAYCQPSNACQTACGYAGGTIDDGCGTLLNCEPTEDCDTGDQGDPGDPGDPGTPTTTLITTTTGLIPVTGGAGGPTEELVLIPVTGVNLGDLSGAGDMLVNLGLLFFGAALVLEGLTRKNRI